MADFTLKAYNSLLDKMLEEGYEVMTFGRYLSLKNEKLPEKFIVLRHDVDKKPGNSLKTAEMESSKGISATYFFRMRDCSYDEGIVARIRDLGHEIGYHYEDLVLANGDKAFRGVFGDNAESGFSPDNLHARLAIVRHRQQGALGELRL